GADAAVLRFHAVQVAPNGDRLYLLGEDGTLQIWDLDASSGGCRARAVPVGAGLPEGLTCLALRPDGAVLALGDRTGAGPLFDARRAATTGRIKATGGDGAGFVPALAFSPDGRDLAVGTQQGAIVIWPATGPAPSEPRLTLPGHRGMISSLAFDARGRRLA